MVFDATALLLIDTLLYVLYLSYLPVATCVLSLYERGQSSCQTVQQTLTAVWARPFDFLFEAVGAKRLVRRLWYGFKLRRPDEAVSIPCSWL